MAAKIWGAKVTQSVLLFGQAVALALMPLAARIGKGPLALAVCMTVVGVLQAPLVPGLAPMERVWMPPGPERALSLRIPHLGMRFSFISALTIPLLATRYGWRSVPYIFGGASALLGVVWTTWATDTPDTWRGPPVMSTVERELFGLRTTAQADPGNGSATIPGTSKPKGFATLSTYFFRVPQAYLPVLGHTTIVAIDYAIMQWSPTRYLYELGCSPAQMGLHVALPNIVDVFSQFVSSAIEARVNRAGMQ